jgi:uncharacterized membrane protein
MDASSALETARQWLLGLPPAQQAVGLAALTLVPWIELRGSIPLAIALGWHPVAAAALAVAVNCLLVPPTYFGLEWFYARWLSRLRVVRRVVEGVRRRGGALVERYELLGLALFVAVPLPGTGAYSGTALAWLAGLPRWRAMAAVAAGVWMAAAAVTLLATGAAVALRRWF